MCDAYGYGNEYADQYTDGHGHGHGYGNSNGNSKLYTEWRSTGTVGNRNTRTGTQV